MNKYYDLVGKKIKLKDCGFEGTLVQVEEDKLVLVNDHGVTYVYDMPQIPYVNKMNRERNAVGEWVETPVKPDLYNALKDFPNDIRKKFTVLKKQTSSGNVSYAPAFNKQSLSSYSTNEEADAALLDFVVNYYIPNKDEKDDNEILEMYRNGESYATNKQAREEKRTTESIQEGVKKHVENLATGGTTRKNTSGYNGISYNNPINDGGWEITKSKTRNGKPLMIDQICIYGFKRLAEQIEGDLVDFIFYEIKNPVDVNDTSRNVFEYANLISAKVNEVCQEKGINFDSNNLEFELYRCPEKRLYNLCGKLGVKKDPRAFKNLYWQGESEPLLINQITSDDYINSFDKELLDMLYTKNPSRDEFLDLYNQSA